MMMAAPAKAETINDDGTITRTYALRLPAQTWTELDVIAANQHRETITLITSILPSWARSYVETWRQLSKAAKGSR